MNENKDLVRKASKALFEDRNLRSLDQYVSDDFIDHNPPGGVAGGGADATRKGFEVQFTAFPDVKASFTEVMADGDRVFARHVITGTHKGELMGLQPTNKKVTYEIWHIFRIADGKIAEHWAQVDLLGLLRQVGASPKQMAGAIQPHT
jgi:predicted ester cyclase